MSEENRYRQLSLFAVIVAEMVITPSTLGGLAYFLAKGSNTRVIYTGLGVMVGLGIAIYRIYLMSKKMNSDSKDSK